MGRSRWTRAGIPLGLVALAAVATGCGAASGSEGDTYTIAYLGTLSGASPQLGINERNAVKLAVDQANESGDLPFTLKFAESDDAGDPAQAPAAAQKLIDDDSVVAIVGPAYSGPTKAVGQILADANLTAVSPSATNPTLTSLGFSSFFRVVPPDDAQGSEVSKYISSVDGAKTVYLVDDKSDYGVGLADVVESSLKSEKVTVTREGVPVTKDYTAVAQKIATAKTDAVFYSGYYEQAAAFAKAVRDAGYEGTLVTGDGANDDQLVVLGGDAVEGMLISCPCNDPNVDPASKDFAADYVQAFDTKPGTYSAEGYDAANAIIGDMKSIDGDITRQSVLDAVHDTDYKGLTKQVKFTDKGEVEGTTIYMYKVTDGKREVLGTTRDLV